MVEMTMPAVKSKLGLFFNTSAKFRESLYKLQRIMITC